MATIDASYFFGPLLIAQKTDNAAGIQWLINELEPKLLRDIMGYELYKAYTAGVTASTQKYLDIQDGKEYSNRSGIPTKWNGIAFTYGDAKKSLIANYVYWHWMEKEASISTGTGEKTANAQNAVTASPVSKMVRAWNDMVCMIYELCEFLLSNQTDYPEFVEQYSRIPCSLLKKQNAFGI